MAAPSDLTAFTAPDSSSEIDLSWTNNSQTAFGFSVERSTGGSSFVQVASLGPNAISYQDTHVQPGTQYTYQVIAIGPGDPSGPSNTDSATTLPTVTVSGDTSIVENTTYTLTPQVTYDSAHLPDPITGWTLDWGDGVTESPTGDPATFNHSYAQPGFYVINATAHTANGSVEAATTATVNDPSATLSLVPGFVTQAMAGHPITLPVALDNPGNDVVSGWVMDWGDGTVVRTTDSAPPSFTHTYPRGGTAFHCIITAFTDDAAVSLSFYITVNGLEPTSSNGLAIELANDVPLEGKLLGFVVDDSGSDQTTQPITYTINWGDGTQTETYQMGVDADEDDDSSREGNASHTYAEQGTYLISMAKADGTVNESWRTVDDESSPTIDPIADQTVGAGQQVHVLANFTGMDADGPLKGYVDWGDGHGPQPADLARSAADPGSGAVSASLVHAPAGDYSGTLTVYDEAGSSTSSSFNLHVVGIKLEVAGAPDSTKSTVGGLIAVDDGFYANNHDSSGNPVPDNQPDASAGFRIVAADLNLADASLSVGANGVSGTWQLSFPNKIKVWRVQPDGTFTPVTSGQASEEINQAETISLKIQGMGYSDAPRDVHLSASFTADSPGSVGTLNDAVVLTIPKMEFVTYNAQTGQESPVDDVTYASDPRPQVSLSVTDAHIDSNGYLSVTMQGEVTDQLSEIMPNAADRVQSLQFIVNGQVIDALSNLPASAPSAGATQWRPFPFDVHFQRTLTIDPLLGSALVIRAQTSPNAAGSVGWHDVGVTLSSVDASQYPDGQISNPTNAGAHTVGDDNDPSLTYIPIVQAISDLGGSPAGSFEPMMLRIDNLDDQLAQQVHLTLNGVPQAIAPFDDSAGTGGGVAPLADPSQSTGYHGRYYMVFKDRMGQRRILVTTFAKGANPDLSQVKPDNVSASDGPNVKFTLMHNGKPMLGATTMEMPLNFGPETPTNLKGRKWDMPEMLTWFRALFGNEGMEMLGYFQAGGNTLKRFHFWRNMLWEIGDKTSAKAGGTFEIKVEEETDPISAAIALYQGLQASMGFGSVLNQIPVDADHFQQLMDSYKANFNNRASLAATLAKAYLSGIAMSNIGGVVAVTVYDAGSGDYAAAAIDLIPLVAPLLLKSAKDFILLKVGGEELQFNRALVQAMLDAEASGATLAQRMAIIEQRVGGYQNLSLKMRKALVESDVLRGAVPTNRGALADNLGAAPGSLKVPQAHHDLPWTFKDWFAAHGIDVNEAQYGRWVEGTPPGGDPANWRFHQGWTPQFQKDWAEFMEIERTSGIVYSRQQILNKMADMRVAYPSGGIGR
ncbi:MAG: hypothetical protein JWN24_3526 [Phycisphaerales bacterium]|nr:hypothetical protein [Phycisphaerales bacterium]